MYVSLYKYFVAPFGGILAGSDAFVSDLYHDRRMFGGGLASASLIAGVALRATEGFKERFGAAMDQASTLFARVNDLDGISIGRFEHGSNIFPLELDPGVDADRFVSTLLQHWVFAYRDEFVPGRIFSSRQHDYTQADQRRTRGPRSRTHSPVAVGRSPRGCRRGTSAPRVRPSAN